MVTESAPRCRGKRRVIAAQSKNEKTMPRKKVDPENMRRRSISGGRYRNVLFPPDLDSLIGHYVEARGSYLSQAVCELLYYALLGSNCPSNPKLIRAAVQQANQLKEKTSDPVVTP